MPVLLRVFVAIVLASLGNSRALWAGDWPQILGPQRNGVAEEETLEKLWKSDTGPKTVWQKSVGSGLAGVAVARGAAYVFHRLDDTEVLEAVDALTGKGRWKAEWKTDYDDTIAGDNGPRCIPVVQGDSVIAFGAAGQLACLRVAGGSEVWSKNVVEEYQAPKGYFGVGSTPLVEGDIVIVNVGGPRGGAGIVGFDLKTGKERWKAVSDTASYSSPVAATIDGTRHVLCITRLKLVSLDPSNGAVRFEFPFGKRGPTVNGANPLVIKSHVLATASYGIGATLAKIGKNDKEILWSDDEILSSQYSTPVYDSRFVFAVDGREDQGRASVRCFDPFKKQLLWEKEDFGLATPILAGKKILLMKSDGTLVVIEASPDGFKPLKQATLFEGTTRALPALANGLLYVRDTRQLKCFDLRQ